MNKMALLGLFIFGALVILFAGVFVIGNQQRMFTHSYRLRTEFTTVSGLLGGAEVRLGGVRKGTVDEIRLPSQPGGKVRVLISLDTTTRPLVKQDSLATIETEGLLGNKFLAISFGSPGSAGVKDWDTLASQAPLDISELFKKTSDIMDTTHSALKHFETTSEHVAAITERIDRGDGSLGALLKDRALYNQLTAATTNIAATSGEARKTVAQARIGVTAFTDDMQALKQNVFFRGYFKDRGYLDSADLTRWEIATIPADEPMKTFQLASGNLFDKPESAKLKDPAPLQEIGAYLTTHPFRLVVIQAFSSPQGDQDANLLLTQGQAMVVRAYLAETFAFDDSKLKTKGMGETPTAEPGQTHWLVVSVYAMTGGDGSEDAIP